jgi:hypothetical protein
MMMITKIVIVTGKKIFVIVTVCCRPASNTIVCRLSESGLTAELLEPPQLMTVVACNDSSVGHSICFSSMCQ